MARFIEGTGTNDDPWHLSTPPGGSEYTAYRDEAAEPPALIVQVGSTRLSYHLRAIDDLHAMLKGAGAIAFLLDYTFRGSPASFLLFAAADGALALLTLWALLRQPERH